MSNIGTYPIDPTSDIGKLRMLVGDTAATELQPPLPGHGNYAVFSDVTLAVVLGGQGGNQLRAAGTLFLQLAAEYAQTGKSIKTDDLAIDTRTRGGDLRSIAQSFFDQAQDADATDANDFFQIVPFAGRARVNRCIRPEAAPWPM